MPIDQEMYADAAAPEAAAPEEEPTDQSDTGQTAEVPKAVLGDVQPGDQVTLEVVQVMEDSVLVRQSSAEPEPETTSESETPEPAAVPGGGGGPMSSMME